MVQSDMGCKYKIHVRFQLLSKWSDQQGINLQNIQTAHAAQYQKKKKERKTTQSKNGQKI